MDKGKRGCDPVAKHEYIYIYLKLIGSIKFNHLIITLTLILIYEFKLSVIRWGSTLDEIFNLNKGELTESKFDPKIFSFKIIIFFKSLSK